MKITASQIKQNSSILQKALLEDIVVTKRDQPFVVIVEYEKYFKMKETLKHLNEKDQAERLSRKWLESAKESEMAMDHEDVALYRALEDESKERFGEDRA